MIQLLFDKKTYYVLGGILVVIGVILGLYKVENYGYQRGLLELNSYKLEIAQKVTEERNRQSAANEYAKQKEAENIKVINQLMSELNRKVKESESEAHNDPDANRPALNAGSVMRINKINVPKPPS